MLTELHIENFAIIEKLDVAFKPGLITFTGETGAGKSIIIDAVETLLGGRADVLQVRTGAERASVEAVFTFPEASKELLLAILEREGLLDETEHMTLSREVRVSGRNIARINGRNVSATLLRELGEYLVDVHGQSEHLSLLRVSQHLGLLDRYGSTVPLGNISGPAVAQQPESILTNSPLPGLLDTYQKIYQRLLSVQDELANLRQVERDVAHQIDMLGFQIKEIEGAHLNPGEEEVLREERNRLVNAEALNSLVQQALLSLDESTPETPAITDLLGNVTDALDGLSRLDPSQAPLNEQVKILFENLTELARNLRLYLENIEFNPRRLDQVEERLTLIQSLKRKYGDSIPEILEFLGKAKSGLEMIAHSTERLQELEVEEVSLLNQLGKEGHRLSQYRREAARQLEHSIETELSELHMSGAHFKVDFQQQSDPEGASLPDGRRVVYHPYGLEKVEFLIAPNPGEGFKPLAKIASGGETSRLMLALKNVLVQADHIPTLIFDEIDQGIGGRIGAVVGQKLWRLGRRHQVLCVTHLPQLAAYGEFHFHVEKEVEKGRTLTQVRALEDQERLIELAQMLGGISEGTLQSASELLQAARDSTDNKEDFSSSLKNG
jgi:DNA repair protein RecN (Recombination protein N)